MPEIIDQSQIPPWYGRIQQVYEVTCAICGTFEHGGPSRRTAEKRFRQWGWTTRNGLWVHEGCLEPKEGAQ